MAYTESGKEARYRYEKSKLKRIPLDVQQSFYEEVLKPAADAAGEKINTYIKNAILQRIESERKS